MDDAELEAKVAAFVRGLFTGASALQIRREPLEAAGAVVWTIQLIQVEPPPAPSV